MPPGRAAGSGRLPLLFALLLSAACAPRGAPAPAAPPIVRDAPTGYDPSRALGPLFHAVQLAGIFPDSKTFVDAQPRSAPAAIAARYAAESRRAGFSLAGFVAEHFEPPPPPEVGFEADAARSMEAHIRALWPVLTAVKL